MNKSKLLEELKQYDVNKKIKIFNDETFLDLINIKEIDEIIICDIDYNYNNEYKSFTVKDLIEKLEKSDLERIIFTDGNYFTEEYIVFEHFNEYVVIY